MKGLFNVSPLLVFALLGTHPNLLAQEVNLDKVPLSDETIRYAEYPVRPDPDLGVSSARLGEGSLYQTDLTLVEIPPGGQLPPGRHLAEEMIYIIAGEGYTTMWARPGEKPQRYDWSAGDLLSPSLNAWHQHFNTSPDTPARYVSMTSTPLSNNLYQNREFLLSSEFVFEKRWQQGITQKAEYKGPGTMDMKAGHHLPDLPGRKLQQRADGSSGITIRPDGDMAGNHILQMLVREYQADGLLPLDGHTHPWEVVYFVLEGEGSTLLKRGDEPARIVNWEKGDMFIVEANEYHDNGGRMGSDPGAAYPRIMQMRASGYFFGVGNVGEEDHTPIKLTD
jgi:quercetin dioxygenase-like cupin family protein